MANPMYQLLGIPDPTPGAGYDQYFASVPDTSWIQARGIMPQTQTGNMGPQQPMVGYPTQAGQMGPQMDPTQNPYALAQKAYEDSHIKALNGLDITKPTFARDAEDYLLNQPDQSLAQNQRVQSAYKSALSSHKELQQYFQKSPKAAQTYANLIKNGKSPDEAIGSLRQQSVQDDQNYKLGLLAADNGLDPQQFQGQDGNLNELSLHSAVFNRKQQAQQIRIPLSKDDREEFKTSMQNIKDAQELDTSGKDMIAKKKALIDGGQAKDWVDADAQLKKQALNSAMQEHQALVHTYEGSNYSLSPMYYTAGGMEVPQYHSTGRGKIQMGPGGQQGTGSQGPPADPFSGPAWNGGPVTPQASAPTPPIQMTGVAASGTISPADLTKNDLYNLPPDTLENRIASQGANERNQLIIDTQAQQAKKQAILDSVAKAGIQDAADLPQYQAAWEQMKSAMTPSDLTRPYNEFADDTFLGALNARSGQGAPFNPQGKVFTDSAGKPVFWRDVAGKFRNSPHFDELRDSLTPKLANNPANISSIVPVNKS